MVDGNERLVGRIFEEGLNGRDYAVWDDVFAGDLVAHSAVLGRMHGVESVKRSFAAFITPAPDFRATIDDTVASRDRVVVRVTYRGTDQGGFFGRPATGKPFVLTAIYIFRMAHGRVVELWQEADRLGMMQQLDERASP